MAVVEPRISSGHASCGKRVGECSVRRQGERRCVGRDSSSVSSETRHAALDMVSTKNTNAIHLLCSGYRISHFRPATEQPSPSSRRVRGPRGPGGRSTPPRPRGRLASSASPSVILARGLRDGEASRVLLDVSLPRSLTPCSSPPFIVGLAKRLHDSMSYLLFSKRGRAHTATRGTGGAAMLCDGRRSLAFCRRPVEGTPRAVADRDALALCLRHQGTQFESARRRTHANAYCHRSRTVDPHCRMTIPNRHEPGLGVMPLP